MDLSDRKRKEERLRQLQQEQAQLEQQLRVQQFAANYPIQLQFPAEVSPPARTNVDLIQHRLLEANVLFDLETTVGESVASLSDFIVDLERTGCFNAVKVTLANGDKSDEETGKELQKLVVSLDERKWYRLHAGGGIKTNDLFNPEQSGDSIPTAEFDLSVGLRNVAGHLDKTDLQYTLDTKSVGSWSLIHERPLYTALPTFLEDVLLAQPLGSRASLVAKAVLDTVDFEWTRSYKEYHRLLSLKASNVHSVPHAEQSPENVYYSLEWSALYRDMIPRRTSNFPFRMDASPEIVSQSVPSFKHSIAAEFVARFTDNPFQPTAGVQCNLKTELATPPGDIGFVKCETNAAIHVPMTSAISLHGIISSGILKSLSWGGLCKPATISDRFFVGGPLSFRGFLPAGIGPRARSGGSAVAGGDSLGGDFYYTATFMASTTPAIKLLESAGLRVFGFLTAGTCAGAIFTQRPWMDVLLSTRCSAGVGISTAAIGPRLEATYSIPLRYGPRDNRRQFQFGLGFTCG